MAAPTTSWYTSWKPITNPDSRSPIIHAIAAVVSISAIGSLLLDSSSSRGRNLCLSPMLLERSTENTAAASVDDTMAPKRNASAGVKGKMK